MGVRALPLLVVLGSVALLPAEDKLVDGKFQDLLTRNPFSPPEPPPPPPAPEPPPTLELRGVVNERGTLWFSLYDTETKKGMWVRRDETVADYLVREFDLARETLFLEGRSRRLALALKSVKLIDVTRRVASVAPPGQTNAASLPKTYPRLVQIALDTPVAREVAKQKAAIGEQVRERRAQRLRAMPRTDSGA